MMEWADRTRHFGIRSRLILLFTAFAILFFVFLPISAYYLAGPNSVVVQRVGNIGEYSLSGPSGSATFLVSLYAGSAEYVKSVNFLTVLLPLSLAAATIVGVLVLMLTRNAIAAAVVALGSIVIIVSVNAVLSQFF